MAYVLSLEIATDGAPAPTPVVISFDLPPGGTDTEAVTLARGFRRAVRDVYDTRVRLVSFQQTGLTRDVDLNPGTPPA